MVLWRLSILPSLVRPARASTRHQTQNPGMGICPPTPDCVMHGKWCRGSALEALVRLSVVQQIADAIDRVLEDRCGGEDDDTDLGIDERDGAESGDETGDFPDEAEIF